VFSLLGHDGLLIVGGALIVAIAVLLAVRSFVEEAVDGLSLTTSVSMLVTYGVGALVVEEFFIEAVTVAMLSSLLLVLKRELHQFAWGLSREEVRSAVEFTIIAFVVFPLLPAETIDPWGAVQPRLIWSLVVAVSAIGFVNYVLVKRYQGRGYAVTGFFGGLVNSTAVVAEMAKRARGRRTYSISPSARSCSRTPRWPSGTPRCRRRLRPRGRPDRGARRWAQSRSRASSSQCGAATGRRRWRRSSPRRSASGTR